MQTRDFLALAVGGCAAWACTTFDEAPSDSTHADASADVATNRAPFCATNPGNVCADFDDPQSAGLPTTRLDDGGTMQVVDDPHFSPPNALRMTFAKPADKSCHHAFRGSSNVPVQATNGFHAEYRLRVGTLTGSTQLGARVFMVGTDNVASCNYYLELTPTGATYVVGVTDTTTQQPIPLAFKPLVGVWSHIVLDVRGIPGGRKATVTVDGKPAAVDVALMGACQNEVKLERVELGLHCLTSDVGDGLDVAFDDLRVEVR